MVIPTVGGRVTRPRGCAAPSDRPPAEVMRSGRGRRGEGPAVFLGGFKLTFQHLIRPRVTTQYPEEKRPKPPRLHGRHVLNRYEDGMEKCIGCELCAGVCPADCIYVRGADNPPDHPVSPGERYGFVYEINYLRCIHCDMCVEACPTEAITESKLFEFSFTNRADAIYTKAELVVDDDGKPQHLPWEDWREGDDLTPRAGCGPPRRRAPRPTRARCSGRASSATACAPPEGGQRGRRDDEATGTKPLREVLEAHLLERTSRWPTGACRAASGGPRWAPSATSTRWKPRAAG